MPPVCRGRWAVLCDCHSVLPVVLCHVCGGCPRLCVSSTPYEPAMWLDCAVYGRESGRFVGWQPCFVNVVMSLALVLLLAQVAGLEAKLGAGDHECSRQRGFEDDPQAQGQSAEDDAGRQYERNETCA